MNLPKAVPPSMLDAFRRALPVLVVLVVVLVMQWIELPDIWTGVQNDLKALSPWWGMVGLFGVVVVAALRLRSEIAGMRELAELAIESMRDLPQKLEETAEELHDHIQRDDDGFDLLDEVKELAAHRRLHEQMDLLFVTTDGHCIIDANAALIRLLGEDPRGLPVSEYLEAFTSPEMQAVTLEYHDQSAADVPPSPVYTLPLGPRVVDDDLTDGRVGAKRHLATWFVHSDPSTHRTYSIGYVHESV